MRQQILTQPGERLPGATTQTSGKKRFPVGLVLWIIGFIILVAASVMVHLHPGPWPIDLQTTIFIQHLHMAVWILAFLNFISFLNDPIPSLIAMALWLVGLALFRRFLQGIFIAIGTALADGIDGLIGTIVGRPRPASPLIHVYVHEPFHSFPSGHTEHDMVYYGFLLFLSFTKPVRQWRYHWLLLPLQIFAVLAIITIGVSRVYEGSHWITDIFGGYLSGALMLYLLIIGYRWAHVALARRRERKRLEQGK